MCWTELPVRGIISWSSLIIIQRPSEWQCKPAILVALKPCTNKYPSMDIWMMNGWQEPTLSYKERWCHARLKVSDCRTRAPLVASGSAWGSFTLALLLLSQIADDILQERHVIITCTAAVIHNYVIRGKWKLICGERSWRKTWRRKEQQQRRSRKETHRTSDLWHRGRWRAAHSKLVFYWDYRLLSFFSLWCRLFRLIALLLLCCWAGSHRLDAKWGQCLHINKPSAATAH